MKKRILIIGNNEFSREYYEDGVFKINNKKYIKALYQKYEIDNLSKDSLSCDSAIRMSKFYIENNKYSSCIIALGLDEARRNTVEELKDKLSTLLEELISKDIEPILLEIDSEKYNVSLANSVIREVKKEYKLSQDMYNDLIVNGSKLQFC
jgi:hypothetical protein